MGLKPVSTGELLDFGKIYENKWKELKKLQWLSIQERKDEDWCGYLTTAAVMLSCQMMCWMSTKWTLTPEGSSKSWGMDGGVTSHKKWPSSLAFQKACGLSWRRGESIHTECQLKGCKKCLEVIPIFYMKIQRRAISLWRERHIVYMLPKYHCELNPIERVWAQAKRYSRAHCKYNLVSLRKTIIPALESVPL